MIVIEAKQQKLHHPNWKFTVGNSTFHTRDVPQRIHSIVQELKKDKTFKIIQSKSFPSSHIKSIHPYHDYIKIACSKIKGPKAQFLPDLFPGDGFKSNRSSLSPFWMGQHCSSAVTPLMKNTYKAAKGSVDAALTGAEIISKGAAKVVYSLCRPPGHHAGPRMFGGYCYFNNVAVAANWLSKKGRVAIIDIDYHHGDGTQEHFIHRFDVLTVSIHGDPAFDFPYFTGYKDEIGHGRGKKFNKNYPIPLKSKSKVYMSALTKALNDIRKFKADYLIVAAGFDTYSGDPVGNCRLTINDYAQIGQRLARLKIPTLICQEGGYNIEALARCVHKFLNGFSDAFKKNR